MLCGVSVSVYCLSLLGCGAWLIYPCQLIVTVDLMSQRYTSPVDPAGFRTEHLTGTSLSHPASVGVNLYLPQLDILTQAGRPWPSCLLIY